MPLRDAPKELDFPKPEPPASTETPSLGAQYTAIANELQQLNFVMVARLTKIKRLLETAEITAKSLAVDGPL